MPSGNQTIFLLLPSDNLMTDIYGANLYNRYLAQQHAAMATSTKFVAQGTVSQVTMAVPEEELVSTAAQCHSLLVRTDTFLYFKGPVRRICKHHSSLHECEQKSVAFSWHKNMRGPL